MDGYSSTDIQSKEDSFDSPSELSYTDYGDSPENEANIKQLKNEVSKNAYDYSVQVQYIEALRHASLYEELTSARENMHNILPLSEELWVQWIEDEKRIASTPDQIKRVINLYSESFKDYFSIKLWNEYIQYVIDQYKSSLEDDDNFQVVTLEEVRNVLREANKKAGCNIPESYIIWNTYLNFETEIMQSSQSNHEEQKLNVRDLYLDRLSVPHKNLEQTWQDYSQFISKNFSGDYESIMVEANKIYSKTSQRYRKKETYEDSLVNSNYSLVEFRKYINYEENERSNIEKSKDPEDKKYKQIAHWLVIMLYERALVYHYIDETFWDDYIGYLLKYKKIAQAVEVAERSVRNCPWSGMLWSRYIRILVKNNSPRDVVMNIVSRALDISMLNSKDRLDDLIKVLLTYCDYERSRINWRRGTIDEEHAIDLRAALQFGLEKVSQAVPVGDPRSRLEFYYIEFETQIKNYAEARKIWEEVINKRKHEPEIWLRYAEWEKSLNNIQEARNIFKRASQVKFDWPEVIFESWENFEHHYGDFDSIENALLFIKSRLAIVMTRREKVNIKLQQFQNEAIEIQQFPNVPTEVVNMENMTITSRDSLKRKPEETLEELHPAKRNKEKSTEDMDIGQESSFVKDKRRYTRVRRDREHSTIAVVNLPEEVKQGQLKTLFNDCGKINEVRIIPDAQKGESIAYIEFSDRDSVLGALTKDKKKIGDNEISVYQPIAQTLYITNFSESTNEQDLLNIFEKYGEIIDIRMPSANVKGVKRRRFCYIEYKKQESARAALAEDGQPWFGFTLSVHISDPDRKKQRSPPAKNEIIIHNLPSQVDQNELKTLFQPYGTIKNARINLNEEGKCTGTAFIDFLKQEEAQAAAKAMNQVDFKNNCLHVVVADPNIGKKSKGKELSIATKRDRGISVKQLPKNITKENLQELFAKCGTIRDINYDNKEHTAEIEYAGVEDAGKAILRFDKYEWHGVRISVKGMISVKQQYPTSSKQLVPRTALMPPRSTSRNKVSLKKVFTPSPSFTSTETKEETTDPVENEHGNSMDVETITSSGTVKKSNADFRRIWKEGKS
ncbi:2926_t:CDS:10 [Ambispora gerdemannii]|uniref:2926_t:CDS:1 n=1 Tax=Ambispora gerdemannii TaxID=144530 RepID=A0A9N8UXU6_9GLOM|nr:2926_t:CDS:10 [Ambispora gerdemannii]